MNNADFGALRDIICALVVPKLESVSDVIALTLVSKKHARLVRETVIPETVRIELIKTATALVRANNRRQDTRNNNRTTTDDQLFTIVGDTYGDWFDLLAWLSRRRPGVCPGCSEKFDRSTPNRHWLLGFECHRKCFEVKQQRTARHNVITHSWHCPGKPQANIAECIEKYPKEYLPSLYQVPQATTVPADVKIKGDTVR